ncbi:MAG: hypothetical protein HKN43_08955 [Rhodothermales bacterium]|nr:hypothetical protein [Rhodothermales bacterium]
MNRFVRSISDLCERYPVTTKTIFSNSRQVGYNLSNTLLRHGRPWANLDFNTPVDHAYENNVDDVLAGWVRVPFDLPAFIILAVLDRDPALRSDLLGADTRLSAGILGNLERSISKFRRSGLSEKTLERTTDRQKAFAQLVTEYSTYLSAHQLLDDATILSNALSRDPRSKPNDTAYAILAAKPFVGLDGMYVSSICGKSSGAGNILRTTNTGNGKSEPTESEHVSVRYAIGQKAEASGVIEEVLSRGLCFDEVEIAYTNETGYLADLANISFWLPDAITFANGIPVTLTNPGRALLGYLQWISSGFDNRVLIRLLRSRTITLTTVSSFTKPEYAASNLEKFRAGSGTNELARVARIVEEQAGASASHGPAQPSLFDIPGKAERAIDLGRVLRTFVDYAPAESSVQLMSLVSGCKGFLKAFGPSRNTRDAVAMESIIQRLDTLETEDLVVSVKPAVDVLSAIIRSHKMSASVATPGTINVVPLDKAGCSGRSHVFVVGMDDETFPGRNADDYYLSLAGVAPAEAGAGTREVNEQAISRLIEDESIELVLVSQRADPADGSEVHPAPLLREFEQDPGRIDYSNSVASTVSVRPYSGVIAQYRNDDFIEVVQVAYPWLDSGKAAATARRSAKLTEYDGVLRQATPELSLSSRHNVVSASAMEGLAGCSYRYFLQRVLNVRLPEDPPDDYKWLSALQKGRLLHDLLYRYHSGHGSQKEEGEQRSERLHRILEKLIAKHAIKNPPHNAAGLASDKASLLLAAEIFLAADADISEEEPYALELKFGFDNYGKGEGPLKISLSADQTIMMRGAIDRVDRKGSDFSIWDYKSGSTYSFDSVPLREDVRHLQWALYAFAFEEILKRNGDEGSVIQSGYFFIGDRGNGQRVTDMPPGRSEIGERLRPLFEMVSHGTFVHAHREKSECRFCDFNPICGGENVLSGDLPELESPGERAAMAKNTARKWLSL